MSDDDGTIRSGEIGVDVDWVAGGRVAQIVAGGTPLLVAEHDVETSMIAWGAYPMVPWAGRIRDGRFEFDGRSHQLPCNQGRHAMHGVGFALPWEVEDRDTNVIGLRLELPTDDRWPFGGHVTQLISVDDAGVDLAMTVIAHDRAFPVSFGWHPWFRKPSRLEFRPTAMYLRDADHIAVDELVDVPRPPWDDCFINREPVAMTIDSVDVVVSSACDHWVVYDEPEHATCVEPQTGPPDAFNIGPTVLDAGGRLTASCRIAVDPSP